MLRTLCLVVFAVVSNLLVTSARADIIAAWELTGVDVADGSGLDAFGTSYAMSSSTSDTNASGVLTLGAGVNPSTAGSTYGFKIAQVNLQDTLAGAISNDHYFDFTISIVSGYQLDLTSINMYGQSGKTGSDSVALLSSVDGFTSGNEIRSLSGIAGSTGGFDTDDAGFGGPIDLSDSRFQGLTSFVSFRLYGWDTTGSTGATSLRTLSGNDLIVNGSISAAPVAVPEPSSLALLGLVGGAIGWSRRRRATESGV